MSYGVGTPLFAITLRIICLTIVMVFTGGSLCAQNSPAFITTIAGNGVGGYSGDGGIAGHASINGPFGVAVDSAGNIYIADSYNHQIRKIAAGTGIITTINTNGLLVGPAKIAVDNTGNLFVLDGLVSLYEISASGSITLLPITELETAIDVAVDNLGNVYVADGYPEAVYKYNIATQTTTVVTSGFLDLCAMTIDALGNIYVIDFDYVLELYAAGTVYGVSNPVVGQLYPIAGDYVNWGQGFYGDGGLATAALLQGPGGLAVDAAGNVYINDSGNFRIRRVSASTGLITTVAGNGTRGYSGDGGIATGAEISAGGQIVFDQAGSLLVADTYNKAIRKISYSSVPSNYHLTFDDEFTSLSTISDGSYASGSGVNWYTHTIQCCLSDTTYGTAMAGIGDPAGQDPYSLATGGGLDIRLQRPGGTWYSGVLASVDSSGNGFSQQYGYFEIKSKLTSGLGTWPAFWLLNSAYLVSGAPGGEIDVFESYMQFPNIINMTLHDYSTSGGSAVGPVQYAFPFDLSAGFHIYGMLWTASTMTFYVDGSQVWQTATPAIMNQPYYPIVDLGLGGGWPTSQTPTQNDMLVQYVRVYAP